MSVTRFQKNFLESMPFSNTCMNTILAASTALSWTVPGNAAQQYRAHFSVSDAANVWVRLNATAVVPVSNTATETPNQERVDVWFQRYVNGGDVLSFISTSTPEVGVSLLLVQDNTNG